MKKNGFTLAEVLITLAVIGIAAVMTIPNLLSKYRKVIVTAKLKSTYSQLSSMLLTIYSQNDMIFIPDVDTPDDVSSAGWSYSYSSAVFNKYFAPNLKIIKELDSANIFSICNYKGEGCYQNPSYKCVILANGAGLCTAVNSIKASISFKIILNPGHKILYAGKDAFALSVVRDISQGDYNMNLTGGSQMSYYSEETRNEFIDACLSTSAFPKNIGTGTSDREYFCTILLYKENWSVPDDYPIKF